MMLNQPDFEEGQRVTVYLNGCAIPGTMTADAIDLSDAENLYMRPISNPGGWFQVRWDAVHALEY